MKARLSEKSGIGQLLVGNVSVTRQGTYDERGQPAEISQEDFDRLKDQYRLEEFTPEPEPEAEAAVEVDTSDLEEAHR